METEPETPPGAESFTGGRTERRGRDVFAAWQRWGGSAVVLALVWAEAFSRALATRLLGVTYLLLAAVVLFFVWLARVMEPAVGRTRAPVWAGLGILLAAIAYLALYRVSQITVTWGFYLAVPTGFYALVRGRGSADPSGRTPLGLMGGLLFAAGVCLPGFAATGDYPPFARAVLVLGLVLGPAMSLQRGAAAAGRGGLGWLLGGLGCAVWFAAGEPPGAMRCFLFTVFAAGAAVAAGETVRAAGLKRPPWVIWLALVVPPVLAGWLPWCG